MKMHRESIRNATRIINKLKHFNNKCEYDIKISKLFFYNIMLLNEENTNNDQRSRCVLKKHASKKNGAR